MKYCEDKFYHPGPENGPVQLNLKFYCEWKVYQTSALFATGQYLCIVSLTYITATRFLCSLSHTLRPDEIQKTCPVVNSLWQKVTAGANLTFNTLNFFHLKTPYKLHFCMLQVAVVITDIMLIHLGSIFKSLVSAGTENLSQYLCYNIFPTRALCDNE